MGSRAVTAVVRVGLTLLAIALAACAAPKGGSPGTSARLLVQNGRAHSLSLLDPSAVRPVTDLARLGAIPWRAATLRNGAIVITRGVRAQDGSVLVVTTPPVGAGRAPAGPAAVHPIQLEAGAAPALVASDGIRFAAIAYGQPGRVAMRPACRVAIVDTHARSIVSVGDLCDGPGLHEIVALAVLPGEADEPRGPMVLAAWRRHAATAGEAELGFVTVLRGGLHGEPATAGRQIELPGAPRILMVAVAGAERGALVYCVVGPPEDDLDSVRLRQWRLLGFNPPTLRLETAVDLPSPLYNLVTAPDENVAYALTPVAQLPAAVARIDLESGSLRRFAALPGFGLGVAVTENHLLIPTGDRDVVWVLDRRTGRTLRSVTAGPGPLGVTPIRG